MKIWEQVEKETKAVAEIEEELEAVRIEFHHHLEIAYTRIRDLLEARQDDDELSSLVGRVENIAETAHEMLRWADRAAVLEKMMETPED